jgi:hypothetical protein
MCRASCKKTYKCVTRQKRMGQQSRLSTWPDVNVLKSGTLAKYYEISEMNKISGIF